MNLQKIKEQLLRHEGLRLKPYRCSAGKLTIGVGRNLDDKGITEREALILLANDIQECIDDLNRIFDKFRSYPENVILVLIDMRFNLGASGFRTFKNMISNVKAGYWQGMIKSMKKSKWYGQVGNRSKNLIKMIEEVIKE